MMKHGKANKNSILDFSTEGVQLQPRKLAGGHLDRISSRRLSVEPSEPEEGPLLLLRLLPLLLRLHLRLEAPLVLPEGLDRVVELTIVLQHLPNVLHIGFPDGCNLKKMVWFSLIWFIERLEVYSQITG